MQVRAPCSSVLIPPLWREQINGSLRIEVYRRKSDGDHVCGDEGNYCRGAKADRGGSAGAGAGGGGMVVGMRVVSRMRSTLAIF